MACRRPCYTQPKFDYTGMACFLGQNMNYSNTGMKVVVMIKDKYNPGTYKYVEKPVMYFIPNDPHNSSTIVAYVAPGHDNNYNYMYLLSKRLNGGYNVFAGDHFTMGLRNGEQFDLHYTSYDYTAKSRPTYLYYDMFIDNNTSPSDITGVVCSTRINNRYKSYDDTLNERCYFFDNLMKYVHNNTLCEKQIQSQFKTHTHMTGGKKQDGGGRDITNSLQEPFNKLTKLLESKIGNVPNLESVEMHIINEDKGIITYCLNESNVENLHVSKNGVEEQKGSFMTYNSLPFDFTTFEFISIEELVQSIDKTISVVPNKMRLPLKDLVLCDDKLDYGKIIEMTKYPMTSMKDCRNTTFRNTSLLTPTIRVSAGGKSTSKSKNKKVETPKQSNKLIPKQV
jgi:hypothetical protein